MVLFVKHTNLLYSFANTLSCLYSMLHRTDIILVRDEHIDWCLSDILQRYFFGNSILITPFHVIWCILLEPSFDTILEHMLYTFQ